MNIVTTAESLLNELEEHRYEDCLVFQNRDFKDINLDVILDKYPHAIRWKFINCTFREFGYSKANIWINCIWSTMTACNFYSKEGTLSLTDCNLANCILGRCSVAAKNSIFDDVRFYKAESLGLETCQLKDSTLYKCSRLKVIETHLNHCTFDQCDYIDSVWVNYTQDRCSGLLKGADDLDYQVAKQILDHPELLNMTSWCAKKSCDTTYCIAGWAAALSGYEALIPVFGGEAIGSMLLPSAHDMFFAGNDDAKEWANSIVSRYETAGRIVTDYESKSPKTLDNK